MRRDLLFLSERIDAVEQAIALVAGRSIVDIEDDRRTRDAIDAKIVYTTATDQLPDLVAMLRTALAELSEDDVPPEPPG